MTLQYLNLGVLSIVGRNLSNPPYQLTALSTMTPLEEKLAQLERLRMEHVRQEEERKAREQLEAEQRVRERELEIELEVLRLEEEEEQKRWEEMEKKRKEEMEKRAAKGGAVVGGARGVPEESGGRERGSRELQDGGGAPVLELHRAGTGVHPGGVSGC